MSNDRKAHTGRVIAEDPVGNISAVMSRGVTWHGVGPNMHSSLDNNDPADLVLVYAVVKRSCPCLCVTGICSRGRGLLAPYCALPLLPSVDR